jgi:hypothetical protein
VTRHTVPVSVYRDGIRYVIGEAGIDIDDDGTINWKNVEVNITHPVLSVVSDILGPVPEGSFTMEAQ